MEMSIISNLLDWFAKNKRPLPWRENPTPYAVLISEVMAQQTRMAQLLPFYERFMKRFPTLDDLAKADFDHILSVFAGMGYYARARHLFQNAKIIRNQYGNDNWPKTRKEWEALPGIGPYTAGAILSIAFNLPEPAVDGNVLRLVARLTNDATDISTPTAKKQATLYIKSFLLLSPTPGELTQAFMELGSLVCTPTNPRCVNCPVVSYCQAYIHNRVKELPVKAKKKPSPVIAVTVLLIYSPKGQILMQKRSEGLLKSMWVFYLTEDELPNEPDAAVTKIGLLLKNLGFTYTCIEYNRKARHTFTHRVWDMTAYTVRVNETQAPEGYSFLSPDDMKKSAIPSAMKYFI
jgi:A/G-specific adenine glycosylase